MLALILFIALMGFGLLFRIAGVPRLSVPLLYAMIIPTVFHGWYYAHYALANGIWYVLLGLVAVSWIMSIIGRIRG